MLNYIDEGFNQSNNYAITSEIRIAFDTDAKKTIKKH